MFTDNFVETKVRSASALDQALRAREQEKEMALLAGMYREIKADSKGAKKSNLLKVLLSGLFTGI